MGKINIVMVFFVLVGFTGGIFVDVEEFQTPWNNLIVEKEIGQNLCVNGEEKCSRELSILKNNLQETNDVNLFQTDDIVNKRGQSRLLEFGNIYSCSCGMDRRLMDLGQSYFPRYVITGKCQSTCRAGSQRCRPKYYPLAVLKMKNAEDGEMNTSTNVIHSKLKDSWIAEKVNVVVGCECGP